MATVMSAGTQQHVVLVVDREQYAVPIRMVREIVRWREPRPMPGQPPHVQGALDLRGEVVMVMDLRERLGSPGSAPEQQDIVVVELPDSDPVGITVDGVMEVLTSDPADHQPAPSGVGCGDYVEGVIVLEGRLVVMLDMERLLGE